MIEEKDPDKQEVLAEGIPKAMLAVIPYMPYAIHHRWTPKQVDEEIPYAMRLHWHDVYKVFMDMRADAEKEAMDRAKSAS